MFRNLLQRLFNDSVDAPPLTGRDAEVAVAALLIRVARADDRYNDEEREQIDRILARRASVSAGVATEWRAAAEMIEGEAPDTVRLTRTIKQRVPLEERLAIVSAMWEVALADGRRSPDEEATVRLTAGLLGVSDRESNLARQRVQAGASQPQ